MPKSYASHNLHTMTADTPQTLPNATSNMKIEITANDKIVYDQFIFFGDSITQNDGNPELGFSWRGALGFGGRLSHPGAWLAKG